jgi:hypothetical protein
MNIPLSPERLASLSQEAAIRNASLAEDATRHTAESIAQNLLEKACDSYAATHETAIRNALASNERLMELGKAVASQPDKLDAVEAAVTKILNA